ncbi:MAG: DUF938 domain-containing protein [Myxococcota bacterium]
MRPSSDAALRNRAPILEVLARHVRPGDHVLEIASGSGQHAVWLAPRLGVTWQPTDPDPAARAAIDAWRAADPADPGGADWRDGTPPGTVLPAMALDVLAPPWPNVRRPDVLVAVNMVHISPWAATEALLRGAGALGPRVLYLYGPYRRGNRHTAPSNEAFDASLRARNPAWGVRDLEAVLEEAMDHGLEIQEIVEMPANNLSVVFG